ncbi:MAG: PAS domain S-box protein [Syntrophales bacterium]
MDGKQYLRSDEHPRDLWRLLAAILVFLYIGAMFIMSRSDLHAVFEPPLLLPIMNTLFAGLIPIAVSIIAARTYLSSGLNSLLFMGCGMMTFGFGAVLAGWLISGQQGPNVNVTIYNSAALLGSVFHALGAVLTLKKETPETMPERRNFKLIKAYSGMFLLVFLFTLATLQGITPPFFIQGVGPTLLRQSVLGSAVILFLLSALVMMRIFTQRKLDFHYWYSLSLLMIALGLFAFFLQRSVGSPIGWLGRSGQYIGGVFALIAVLITFKSARIKGVSMQSAVAGLFRDAELSYRALVETITDAIVSFQQDGKIIQWNTAAEKVFGYRQSEAVGSSLFDLVIGETSIEMFRKEVNHLKAVDDQIKVGKPMEITGKTKDGAIIPMEVSTSAMKARDQWSFVCVFRNITERKNAEAAIQKLNDELEHKVTERTYQLNELNRELKTEITERIQVESNLRDALAESQRFREALDHVSAYIYMKDHQSRYVYANRPTLELFGCSAEELIGCDDSRFFPPDTIKRLREVDSRVFLGEQTAEEIDVADAEGGRRVYWEAKAPIYAEPESHTIWGLVGISTDITAQRRAEENYLTLFREMLDGFALQEIICDEEGRPTDYRFLAINPAFERMTGMKAEDVIGKTVLETLPGTEHHWIETYGKVALTGEPAFFENYSDELKKYFEVTAFRPASNQFACIFADITNRKQSEKEKVRLESQLFQSQKMEAIGTLAGGIAHDFNNILAAIIGYTELASDEDQKELKKQYLQETLKGAERAKNLVRQILTFSRQDGQEKKPLDIKLLLKESIKFLRASIPATIEIQQSLTDESCNIMADPTQMHQVIMNLCTNATHAMKQAGGVLTIGLSAIELSRAEIPRYPDLKPGPYVLLTVRDTGCGIDPAHIQRIFDPFFTTKTRDEGTGLGLSVVFGIVKNHNGIINVYSDQGKGSSFNIYLPRIINEVITSESVVGAVAHGTERILFVDDEPALVDIGTLMLSSLGYEIAGATSSMDALDLFRAEPQRFDLVITDMTLPKMTGIDLSREILQIRPDIPIILCSGIRDSETEAQVASLGIRAYCIKPLTRMDLSRVIRETMDGHENLF